MFGRRDKRDKSERWRDDRLWSQLAGRSRTQRLQFAKRMGMVLVLATSGICVVLLLWLGMQTLERWLFRDNPQFQLRDVQIECNGDVITPKKVMEYTQLAQVTNVFDVDIAAMRENLLKKVPWIKSVEISRRLPDTLIVRVKERVAIARLDMDSYYLTVDRDGFVLGNSSIRKSLPVITGQNLPGVRPGLALTGAMVLGALEVVEACDETPVGQLVHIASLDVRERESVDLCLRDGERVKLSWNRMGERSAMSREHLERKLLALAESLKSATARGKRIATIDMTLENNFPAQEY